MVRNARTDTDAMESPAFDQASKRTTLHLDAFRADSVRDRPIVERSLETKKAGENLRGRPDLTPPTQHNHVRPPVYLTPLAAF